jgi:hypothetical protein
MGRRRVIVAVAILAPLQLLSPAVSTARVVTAQASNNTVCTTQYLPVCARTKDGRLKTFGNACEARRAGATGVKPGACGALKKP